VKKLIESIKSISNLTSDIIPDVLKGMEGVGMPLEMPCIP
jgi:hypothetical protein